MSESIWDTRDCRKYKKIVQDLELPENVVLGALLFDCEGFRILLRDENKETETGVLRVSFGSAPVAHRCMDEGVYPASWSKNIPSLLSIIENSEYVEWFNKEIDGIRQEQPLIHYAIYTVNECIDVIDIELPKVSWL